MKIAIVTGASSGMGREFALQLPYFYLKLDEIWVIARRRERLVSLAAEGIAPYRVFDGDLQKDGIYTDIEEALQKDKPDVRMLVNAAGFGRMGTVETITFREPDILQQMIDLNCRALTRMTTVCLPYMNAESRIVNLASAAAFCPQPTFAVYAATKAYVLSFSRALGAELRARDIYVTAVCPGPVETEFFEVAGSMEHRWKDAVLVSPSKVVHTALKDARRKKAVSVYSVPMKGANLAAKILPHRAILSILSRL